MITVATLWFDVAGMPARYPDVQPTQVKDLYEGMVWVTPDGTPKGVIVDKPQPNPYLPEHLLFLVSNSGGESEANLGETAVILVGVPF
jgi:hypothetical protein